MGMVSQLVAVTKKVHGSLHDRDDHWHCAQLDEQGHVTVRKSRMTPGGL